MPDAWVSVDGRILAAGAAGLALDRGLLYGDGLFETVRIAGGRLARWPAHWERLHRSADQFFLPLPWSREEVSAHAAALLAQSGLRNAKLRVTVTRGDIEGSWWDLQTDSPRLILMLAPLPPSHDHPLSLVTLPWRLDPRSPLAGHKTLNAGVLLWGRRHARQQGADEGVFLCLDGHVAEATASNVFWIERGALHTPPLECGILPGVARRAVMEELAPALDLPVRPAAAAPAALAGIEEMFLTNVIAGISPVGSWDGRPVGSGTPGPWTKRLTEGWQAAQS